MKNTVLAMMILIGVNSYSDEINTTDAKSKKEVVIENSKDDEQLGRSNFKLWDTLLADDKQDKVIKS